MKIAVACDGLDIAVTAATCSSFACYTAQSGVVTGCSNVPNMGITPRERASILQQMGVDALIARQFSPEGLARGGGGSVSLPHAHGGRGPIGKEHQRGALRRAGRRLRPHRAQARRPKRLAPARTPPTKKDPEGSFLCALFRTKQTRQRPSWQLPPGRRRPSGRSRPCRRAPCGRARRRPSSGRS